MSGQWTAQDEAQLEEMMQRRKASFEVLSGAVWSGVAPHVTDHAEAEKLTNAVAEVLLREGKQVGPLFRMFDPTNNGEADGWKRVIITGELYDRICALHKKMHQDGMTWEKALNGAVIVSSQLMDYFANGARSCNVKPVGTVTPVYPADQAPSPGAGRVQPEPKLPETKGAIFVPTPEENKALSNWARIKSLSAAGIMRQALRMYDTVERALEDPSVGAVRVEANGTYTAIPKDQL